jgi:nucleotide-binding universal stress UspA family protein
METVLIATDFSPAAKWALNYGVGLARFFGARVVLIHAFDLPIEGFNTQAPLTVIQDLQYASENALREIKQEIEKTEKSALEVHCHAEFGLVTDVINVAVNKYDAQVVVMGMIGSAGIVKRKIIGSNSLKAATLLSVPVFVVPENCVFTPIRNMIYACDYDQKEAVVPYIARFICGSFNAKLEILHIQRTDEEPENAVAAISELSKVFSSVKHNTLTLRSDQVAETIKSYIDLNECDLILLNPKKHSLFAALFKPSVTRDLIFSLQKPMLLV